MPQASQSSDASIVEFDRELIAFWVQMATQLGFPRSVGEIYGLVFLSEHPLSADDIVEKLGLSRSGAGQGLKVLLDIGAIKPAHQIASRKDHYQLQTDLGILVKLLLNARVLPQLEDLSRRRTALASTVAESGSPHLIHRFETIDRWRKKAEPILTLVKGLAESHRSP